MPNAILWPVLVGCGSVLLALAITYLAIHKIEPSSFRAEFMIMRWISVKIQIDTPRDDNPRPRISRGR